MAGGAQSVGRPSPSHAPLSVPSRRRGGAAARAGVRGSGATAAGASERPAARCEGSRRTARVAIAAGGTAGHVVPALAVAAALRERGIEVVFFGGDRAEAELVPEAGYELVRLAVRGLDRRNPLRALGALVLALRAVLVALRELRRRGVDAVLCCGGYVAAPVGVAARLLGLPLYVTEADSHLGLANRLLSRWSRRTFLFFPVERLAGERFAVVGRPLPPELAAVNRERARERFGIAPDCLCLLVFGGSLGARSINCAAVAAFAERPLPSGLAVLHVTGRRDYEAVAARLRAAGSPPHYRVRDFVKPFAEALACADLVVARAGGSVLEVAACGLPMILVPYPHAAQDHQRANAALLQRAGAALVIEDHELTPERLREAVLSLLAAPQRMAEMAQAARQIARPDAAQRIAEELIGAARGS